MVAGQSVAEIATQGPAVGTKKKQEGGAGGGLGNWDFLTLSAVSKMWAGGITYPYQVIRARLQVYDAKAKYKNARDVMRQVWLNEGFGGFYKG